MVRRALRQPARIRMALAARTLVWSGRTRRTRTIATRRPWPAWRTVPAAVISRRTPGVVAATRDNLPLCGTRTRRIGTRRRNRITFAQELGQRAAHTFVDRLPQLG